jgi:endonuclease/exonuclease/phosphatase (EEP) superfamily protein YafD
MLNKTSPIIILSILVFTLFLTFFSLFSTSYWAENLNQYRLQFFYLSCILLILSFLTKSKWVVFLAIITLSLNVFEIISYHLPSNATINKSAKITLFSLNVKLNNRQFDKIGQAIADSKADYVLLMDVNAECLEKLQPYLTNYPYKFTRPSSEVGGMAVYSRIAANFVEKDFLKHPSRLSILTKLKIESDSLQILAIHPKGPNTSLKFQERNRELKSIAQARNQLQPNLILIGDFNTTPYSPYYQAVRKKMQLKDTQLGRGIQNSSFKAGGWLGLSLDHCWVSEKIEVLDRKLGAEVGAEHLPLVVKLAW